MFILQGDFFKVEDPIWNLLIVNICGYFHTCLVFTHMCGKIHILHRVQLCGFHHTGVFYLHIGVEITKHVWENPHRQVLTLG